IAKAMTGIAEGISSITDVKSAETFVKTMEGANATLKEVLAAAEALDPPTDEEKEAMKRLDEGKGEEIRQKMVQIVAENPDGVAIKAVVYEALNNPQVKEWSDKLDAIYGLENEGKPSSAKVVFRSSPAYPIGARRSGIEGKVVVLVGVAPSGRVSNARVASSSGSGSLDAAALKAARLYRFIPAKNSAGQEVAMTVSIPFNFRLREEPDVPLKKAVPKSGFTIPGLSN
ncbi:energy transducer TonB, partial [Akkermansiaceae bacterium]|nr:energy transducer TonB [Akkermansiaceae bacterium]